ncbi:uncharacterized protein [Dermacentor andersoni]|uniref:uncharacterized protein n=1 Tax=Dermacentor andersoni TaxID=34620 RepID=UPI002415A829|nr:uncharacterized protein LOC126524962 [Dermacentor andersoni]XP_054928431.1 uncharacterized protein LOC129385628 [Dermacentor andersoni]
MSGRRRQRHCFAPGCKTGYQWTKGEQPSLFAVPKDESRRKQWERNLHRKDKVLDETCSVCELHFEPACILRDYIHIIDGKEVRIPRGKPELLPNAVPTLLPNAPSYLSKKAPLQRPPRKRKSTSACPDEAKKRSGCHSVDDEEARCTDVRTACSVLTNDPDTCENGETSLPDDFTRLDVPSEYWSCNRIPDYSGTVYCKLRMKENQTVESERVVVLSRDDGPGVAYSAHLCGHLIETGRIASCEEGNQLLRKVDSYRLCRGALSTSSVPKSSLTKGLEAQSTVHEGTYFSKRCAGKEPSEGQACVSCRYLRKALLTRCARVKRSVEKNLLSTAQKLRSARQKNRRLSSRLSNLKDELCKMQEKNASKPMEVLEAEISALNPKQQECVRQCFLAAKNKSSKGNVYTKAWILECILMKMRGAKLYEHLRKHNIICLPSKSTLKRYLRAYKTSFGFSHKVLCELKKKTRHISSFKLRGGLLVDEIKLSEHLNVTSSGRIEGFVDLGPFTAEGQNVPCDHGMVVMFVPFAAKWTQVIGTFATSGNAKAEVLAKILIEATILAEASGLLVDFITCDGASWNRRMWNILGIGVKNGKITCSREHPVDPSRRLFFLSDFPHLLKCLRNSLLKGPLNTPDGMVSIQPVRQAFKLDSSQLTLKAMPGLTSAHLQPNGFEKMRVTFAFQLFGNRVINGLHFYKEKLESSWGNIDATISFFR